MLKCLTNNFNYLYSFSVSVSQAQEMVIKLTDELNTKQLDFTEELTPDVLSQYKSYICRIAQGVF